MSDTTKKALLVLAVLLAACGSDSEAPHAASALPVPGGGISGGSLDGQVLAFALDASGVPLAGASIWLGEGAEAVSLGTTDAKGFLNAKNPGLKDGAVLSATLDGRRGATYAGVHGSLVTFVLDPTAPAANTTLTGTIAGWDALPAPAAGKYRAARIAASRSVSLATFDALAPSSKDDCYRDATANAPCAFSLEIPANSSRLVAFVVEGDDKGTPSNRSDDTLSSVGIAIAPGPGGGGTTNGASFELLPAASTSTATVSVGTGSGLVSVIGVPGVSENGEVTLFPSFEGTLASFVVPVASGDLANAKLWAVALAEDASGNARSLAVTRGIALPAASGGAPVALDIGDFLPPPSMTPNSGSFEITRSAANALYGVSFAAHDVFILDDRTSIAPPAAVDTKQARAIVTDVAFDPVQFRLADVAQKLSRRASSN